MKAAPEGVTVDSHKPEYFELAAFGLSSQASKEVMSLCADLHRFESVEKAQLKTTSQRVKGLLSISEEARKLREAMNALDVGDWLFLDASLAIGGRPGPEEIPQAIGAKNPLGAHAVYMQRMLCTLANAASSASEMVSGGRPLKALGGRKTTRGAYAGFIGGLAVIVKKDGLRAGRGGQFEWLCNWVFERAGVHSKPEGALRYYLENMHAEYLKLGHVL